VLVRSTKQVPAIAADVPAAAERLMAAYWPGPLTIVMHAQPGLVWDLGDNEGTVAVRMPLDDVCLEVIREVGPLAVTAASLPGKPLPATVTAAQEAMGDAVAVYVDDGERRARPSTIVDLTRWEPMLIRDGDLPPDEVMATARGEGARTEEGGVSGDDEDPPPQEGPVETSPQDEGEEQS
jgi:L-threonylcarbamoyladenylate synthase